MFHFRTADQISISIFFFSWSNFFSSPENKANLAKFLSKHLIANAPQEKVIVVAGGFSDGKEAQL
jgi:hypothetical protein